jgi:hypothetical protein
MDFLKQSFVPTLLLFTVIAPLPPDYEAVKECATRVQTRLSGAESVWDVVHADGLRGKNWGKSAQMGRTDANKKITQPPRNQIWQAGEKWTLHERAIYAAKCSDAQTPSTQQWTQRPFCWLLKSAAHPKRQQMVL